MRLGIGNNGGKELMRLKKAIGVWSVIILLSLLGVIYFCTQRMNWDYRKLLNQIEQKTYNGVEINQELYHSIIERIETKVSEGVELLPIEQFFLGYTAYYSQDLEKAYEYYMPISRINIPNNDNLANVLMNAQLNKICATSGRGEEAIELTYYWFDYYEEHVLKRHIEIIHTLIGQLIYANNGSNVAIDLFERVIAHKDSESYYLLSFMKQVLQDLYSDKGEYGRALEIGMEELAKAELQGDYEIIASQRYGVGSIYAQMHNYEYAKDWVAQCFNIPVGDSQKIAYFKVMSAIQYISCAVMTDNLDGIEEAITVYEENLSLIEERYIPTSKAYFALVLAKYYTAVGDLSVATEMLEVAERIMDVQNSGEAYRMDFLSIAGTYYMAMGEYDKAVQALEEVVNHDYIAHAQSAAQSLIDYYIQIGDTTNIKKYTDKLQAMNSKVQMGINTSYADYAAHKYQYEVKLREMNKEKLKSYMIFFCMMILAIMVIGVLYFRLKVIRHLNRLDGLTQIFNRGHFNKRYEMLKKQGSEFCLVMFDIDNFKNLNDTYGHVYGDYVIKNIAQITKKTLGKAGNVFRYGGEEFAIILEDSNHEQVITKMEEIRRAIEAFEWDMSCKVTVSIGVSCNKTFDTDVINEADRWLYEAKKLGKNRVCYQS